MTGYSNGVVATVHNSDWPDYDVTADTSSGSLTYYEVEHTSRQSCCSIVPTSILFISNVRNTVKRKDLLSKSIMVNSK